jgi:hypothetical protein
MTASLGARQERTWQGRRCMPARRFPEVVKLLAIHPAQVNKTQICLTATYGAYIVFFLQGVHQLLPAHLILSQ